MRRHSLRYAAVLATLALSIPARAGLVATFDDLPFPPALDSATTIQWTNPANSLEYQGIVWDARFGIVGDQYRVGGPTGPLFGLPHSGHYMVTNHTGQSGMTISTSKVLTGAWFGQNEYYGFNGGADQVTIVALNGLTELASVVFDLPDLHPGAPEPLAFVDTGIFANIGPITGYRIDRREIGQQSGNWVADDFQFIDAAEVPAPGSLALLLAGALAWRAAARSRAEKKARIVSESGPVIANQPT
jgi:hypothetical protein